MAIQVVCGSCGASYSLKDEFAGRKLRCSQCESVMIVPAAQGVGLVEAVDRGYDPAFDRDRFFVSQKRLAINEKYYVYDEDKTPILFIERPAHLGRSCLAALVAFVLFFLAGALAVVLASAIEQSTGNRGAGIIAAALVFLTLFIAGLAAAIAIMPKRHITIYRDESKAEPLLEVMQDKKLQILKATYTVVDPKDGFLGALSKNYIYNFFRKRWNLMDSEGRTWMMAKEDSMILSLLRRLLGPFFGLLRTNFIIVEPGTDRVIGEFNRKFTLFDRYVLDMTDDPSHQLDRRLAVALAVLLDTGERR